MLMRPRHSHRHCHRADRPGASISRLASAVAAATALLIAPGALAETGAAAAHEAGSAVGAGSSRITPIPVQLDRVRFLQVTTFGEVLRDEIVELGDPDPRAMRLSESGLPGHETLGDDCTFVSSHSSPPFTSGNFNAQAGFAEDEWSIQSFTIPANQFPIQINAVEQLFVTSGATQQTTTEWSFGIWSGTPGNGTLEVIFSSDDVILPHLVMPPGTSGTVLSVVIDPSDPNQIFVTDNGTSAFSFGFRIDQHNAQTGDGCLGSFQIPTNLNAFPATDTDGLASPGGNWLGAINCGILGCAPGFNPFSALGLCTPSGDWAMDVTWTTLNCVPGTGACCDPETGGCSIQSQAGCDAIGGSYQGDNTDCATANCPEPTVACCFAATGGCLDLTVEECMALNGVPGAAGSSCATTVCFPEGACCLTDGSCVDGVSPEDCDMMNGTFQGDGTSCASVECPEPTGGCCVGENCLELTEGDCAIVSGTWTGPGTTCDDCVACPADWNGDESVNILDVVTFINDWNGGLSFTDFNNDGSINILDVVAFINAWNAGC